MGARTKPANPAMKPFSMGKGTGPAVVAGGPTAGAHPKATPGGSDRGSNGAGFKASNSGKPKGNTAGF